jgi:hypothetical protein
MHVFSMAESSHLGDTQAQFRSHICIPWDEAYELYMDQELLKTLVILAREAQGGAPHGLSGRVFDALRAVHSCTPTPEYARRDSGPFVAVTSTAIWTRVEFEEHIKRMTPEDWVKALETGKLMLKLANSIS